MSYSEMSLFSDFIKPVLYNNCAGYRLHHHVQVVAETIFEGVSEQTVFDLVRGSLGYEEDVRFEDLPGLGLSTDYVRRETRRAVDAVAGEARIYPGIDINVPTPPEVKKTTPQDARASVGAALEGGADGLVLSRKYSEMTWENLEAVGAVLRERGSPLA